MRKQTFSKDYPMMMVSRCGTRQIIVLIVLTRDVSWWKKVFIMGILFILLQESFQSIILITNNITETTTMRAPSIRTNRLKCPQQQLVPFVLEVQGRWGHCARQLFKRLFAKIPIVPNSVSRNFWAHRITLAHARCAASNIVHRFHTMKRHVFGPFCSSAIVLFWAVLRTEYRSHCG